MEDEKIVEDMEKMEIKTVPARRLCKYHPISVNEEDYHKFVSYKLYICNHTKKNMSNVEFFAYLMKQIEDQND